MAGRGDIFKYREDDSIGKSAGDSGMASPLRSSSDETKPIMGRGNLLQAISQDLSKLTIGRGRARLFENISVSTQQSVVKKGSGRGAVFQRLSLLTEQKTSEPKEQSVETTFYCPENVHGNKGHTTEFRCNYIKLNSNPDKGVYVYEITFKPNVDSVNLRMKYLNQHRDILGGTKMFDGVTLYLPMLLESITTKLISKDSFDNSDIEINIQFKKKESLKNCIQFFNILFDRVMKTLKYIRFDRKQYDPTGAKIIPQVQLEIWPGYVTAVDEYKGGLLLCCDVSHKVLCQKNVLETLTEIYRKSPRQFQEEAKKALLGSIVITRYNNRNYRIDDIDFKQNPSSTFTVNDTKISYIDYYKKNYNINIKDLNQPLLISIKKRKTAGVNQGEDFIFCLVPELCSLTGLRDEMRNDHRLMREVATFTRVSPNQRIHALEKFYNNVNKCSEAKEILENWGLSLHNSCESVRGRQLEEETIIFAKKSVSAGRNADFNRDIANNGLIKTIDLTSWLLIYCKSDTKQAQSFCDILFKNSNALGIKYLQPETIPLDNDRIETYVNTLRKKIKRDTQIVVIIFPTSRDDKYAAVKKICCTEIPIPSQVIISRTLSDVNKNRSIVQKIALQINCKLGGSLWAVRVPLKNCMICGIDTYHDVGHNKESVSAFVASLNTTYTNWYSKAVIQKKKEEFVKGLCTAFFSALNAFEEVNKTLPEKVIIYRDGVGDGQLKQCVEFELPQFEAVIKNHFPNHCVKFTFIVVQKRINTRFFNHKQSGYENPLPGAIIDEKITRKGLYDFFLVSQSVRQGTVSPTHYIVLKDDSGFNPDIIQRLSYKLCFLYYNWPGTIRTPACCQYAHKLAFLVGNSIRRTPSEELSDKLFYL